MVGVGVGIDRTDKITDRAVLDNIADAVDVSNITCRVDVDNIADAVDICNINDRVGGHLLQSRHFMKHKQNHDWSRHKY
jgi:hypothetical protein